jgi:hypothetical protein
MARRLEPIAECIAKAAEWQRRAESVTDVLTKRDFLDLARQWREFANSYASSSRADKVTP